MKILALTLGVFCSFVSFGQTWETYGRLPSGAPGRNHPITFAIGDTGYILTGYGATSNSEMQDFYKYDTKSKSWVQAANFPGGRRGFGYGVEHNGKGYAGFGLLGSANGAKNDLWEYDPATGAWKQLASCPCTPRWHPAMVATDGKIFMGLGSSAIGDLKDWYEYDIAANTWTKKRDLPGTERHHPYYFGIGSDVYAGFGHSRQNIFKDMYRYDYTNDSWTQIADLPAQGRVAGTQFSANGKGYVLSGQGETHQNLPTGEFWEYDPNLDSWTSLPAHPGTGRWAPGNWVINDIAYFMCGRSNIEERDIMSFDLSSLGIPAGIEAQELSKSLTIYPNPAQNEFRISAVNDLKSISIMDLNGRLIKEESNIAASYVTIPVEELNSGMYLLKIQSVAGEIQTVRLVKQ